MGVGDAKGARGLKVDIKLHEIPLQTKGRKSGKAAPSPHAAHGVSRDAHGKLRAKGALDTKFPGTTLKLEHPSINRAGDSQIQTFVVIETGEKLKVRGVRQGITFMEFVRAGKPVDALQKQLQPGESLVKVGNSLFILQNVSKADAKDFGGEVLAKK